MTPLKTYLLPVLLLLSCTKQPQLEIPHMHIHTYQEYITLKTSIHPYKEDITTPMINGEVTAYLKDGSKVVYMPCGKKGNYPTTLFEHIYPFDQPFVEIQKTYFCKTKKIESIFYSIGELAIQDSYDFDEDGNVTKVFHPILGNLPYQAVLAWADKEGFIDIEKRSILKGDGFDMNFWPFSDIKKEQEDEKKRLAQFHLTPIQKQKVLQGKGLWEFTSITQKNEYEIFHKTYVLDDFGNYLGADKEEQQFVSSNDPI